MSSHIMSSLRDLLSGKHFLQGDHACVTYHMTIQYSPRHKECRHWQCISTYAMCEYFACVLPSDPHVYVAVLRSQVLFPWKQGAGGKMATPLNWGKRLVLGLVSQVSAQMAFQSIYSPT